MQTPGGGGGSNLIQFVSSMAKPKSLERSKSRFCSWQKIRKGCGYLNPQNILWLQIFKAITFYNLMLSKLGIQQVKI